MKTVDIIANGLLADDNRMQQTTLKWIFDGLNSPFDGLLTLQDVHDLINRPYSYPSEYFIIPWDYIFQQMIRYVVTPEYGVSAFMFFDMQDSNHAPMHKYKPSDTRIEEKMVKLMKLEAEEITNAGRANALLTILIKLFDFKLTQPKQGVVKFGYYESGEYIISSYYDIFISMAEHQINRLDSQSAFNFLRYAFKLEENEDENIQKLGQSLIPLICKKLRNIESLESIIMEYLWNTEVVDNIDILAADFPKEDYVNMLHYRRDLYERSSHYSNYDKINRLNALLAKIS